MAILLKNAHILDGETVQDMLLENGKIAQVGTNLAPEPSHCEEYDLAGKVVVPGFIDIHTHMDKTYTDHMIHNESGTLDEAIQNFGAMINGFTEEEFYIRGKKMLDQALRHGTMALRSHITISKTAGLTPINAVLRLKEEYKHLLNLQVIAFPSGDPDGIPPETVALVKEAIRNGADLIGGTPNRFDDEKKVIDQIFDIAKEMDTDIDLHIDEKDEPVALSLEYTAEKTIRENYQGRVTAGHCCSLSAVPEDVATRVIQKVKDSNLNIVTLPSCNLYLIGRQDKGLIRRGPTRIRELLDAGVNVCLSSDNIRDPFRPFGNADILEETLLTAQVARMSTKAELYQAFMMGTYHPAKAMRLTGYGVKEGDKANLVVLNATSIQQAILDQSEKNMVISNGKIIMKHKSETQKLW